MFTGIIEGTATITQRVKTDDGLRLRIEGPTIEDLVEGDSVAVSGVCLTVENCGSGWFETFLAEETREVTYLGALETGDMVNIERAMPASARFDGHIVQGHVDGTTTITQIDQIDDDWRYTFYTPEETQYLVPKGSIAIDGISLTIADLSPKTFEIAIIPETYELTTLSEKSVGDPVHLEYDVLGKYVERMLQEQSVIDDRTA